MVQSGGYGQAGRGGARAATAGSAAAAMRAQGQYPGPAQAATARGPQAQRMAAGTIVQGQQTARPQQLAVCFLFGMFSSLWAP